MPDNEAPVERRNHVAPHARMTPPASQTRVVLQVLAIICAVAVGLWALHRLAFLVLIVVLAGLFAYVVAPLVLLAARPVHFAGRSHRLSRAGAIALVYVVLAGVASGGTALLLPSASDQINDMLARAPAYGQSILTWEQGWSQYYDRVRIPLELRRGIDQSAVAVAQGAVESIRGSLLPLAGALSNLPWVLLIPIVGFFLLKDAATLRRSFIRALPHHNQLRAHRLLDELDATLAAYTRAQLLACVLVGTLCGVGFAALGIPYSLVLGVAAGVLEFIPLVGPLVLATVAAGISALHAPWLALWAVVLLGVLRVVEDYVIYPRLIRNGIRLHPLAVILAVLAGAELGGIAGMFLAVPTAAIAAVVYRHSVEWRRDDPQHETIPVARAQ